jgi:hypothetical protein
MMHICFVSDFFSGQRTHVSLAFEVPGGWHEEKTAITTTILQVLLINIDVTQILE